MPLPSSLAQFTRPARHTHPQLHVCTLVPTPCRSGACWDLWIKYGLNYMSTITESLTGWISEIEGRVGMSIDQVRCMHLLAAGVHRSAFVWGGVHRAVAPRAAGLWGREQCRVHVERHLICPQPARYLLHAAEAGAFSEGLAAS